MRTLRAPSFHIGAGRAFTRCIPTSDAPCRLPAPTRRLLFRRPAPPPIRFSRADEVRFHRETRIVPPSPRLEEPSPLYEKMEERPKAPSVVSDRLPAFADPFGFSTARTRRLATSDRLERHAVPVTFWLAARAPFRSDTGCPDASATKTRALGTFPDRPSRLIPCCRG